MAAFVAAGVDAVVPAYAAACAELAHRERTLRELRADAGTLAATYDEEGGGEGGRTSAGERAQRGE